MIVSSVAAMASNRVIGAGNKLPWHLPEDLKFFRAKTLGRIIIMGRKTFESVGAKAMPKRLNVVITRQKDYSPEGASANHSPQKAFEELKANDFVSTGFFVFHNIEDSIAFAKLVTEATKNWGDEVMICGGEEIYRQAMPYTDRIYLTVIEQDYPGDAKFPEFNLSTYKLIEKSDRTEPMAFSFRTYER